MNMIRPAKFSLDLEDNVIDSGILDAEPFPVTYKQTTRSLPNFTSITNSSAEQTLVILANPHVSIETIEACITQAFPMKPSLPILVPKPKWQAKTPNHWVEHSDDKDNDDYTFVFKDQIENHFASPRTSYHLQYRQTFGASLQRPIPPNLSAT
jgi:hypothetical protein